jgi:hypothetical protein
MTVNLATYTYDELLRLSRILSKRFDWYDVHDYATAQIVCPQTTALYFRVCDEYRARRDEPGWSSK